MKKTSNSYAEEDSDQSSDSQSHSSSSAPSAAPASPRKTNLVPASSSEESDNQNDDESDGASSSSESSGDDDEDSDKDNKNDEEEGHNNHSSDSDSEEENNDTDLAYLPLGERLAIAKKKHEIVEMEGLDMKTIQKRKKNALKVSRERLQLLSGGREHKRKSGQEEGSNDRQNHKKSKDRRSEDHHGIGSDSENGNDSDIATEDKKYEKNHKNKKSKHAPTEASSKRSDFLRQSRSEILNGIGVDINANRYKPRDPRLSSIHGHLNVHHFERNYAFLQDLREKEMETLKRRIAAYKEKGERGRTLRQDLGIVPGVDSLANDKEKLRYLKSQKADFERLQVERAAKRNVKKKLQQEVSEGKRGVYFLKRKEQKKLELEAKFEELRKRGGNAAVEKALAKRRKKNKSRDAGKMRASL